MIPKNTHNFNTPEGYFEDFGKRLEQRLAQDTDHQADIFPKTSGFGTPDGYFETFEKKVLEKMDADGPKVVRPFTLKKYYFAAASIAIVFALFYIFEQRGTNQLGFEELANADIESYLELNEPDLSPYELAEAIDIDELTLAGITENGLETSHVIEYLNEHLDELDELNLQYDEPDQ